MPQLWLSSSLDTSSGTALEARRFRESRTHPRASGESRDADEPGGE